MSSVENLISDPENEEFLVHSRSSIASILRNLMRENRTISAYLSTSDDMVATTILHVDADKNMVIVEPARDPKLNHIFSDTRNVLFDLKHNNVILQFLAAQTQPARFNGRSAVFLELPDKLLRLQRREFYRVAATVGENVTCVLKDKDNTTYTIEVEDLSLGGVGASIPINSLPADMKLKPLNIYRNCSLRVPGIGNLQLDLQVRNCYEKTLASGKRIVRLGLSYVDLPSDKETLLQKYINRLQLEQLRQDDLK